MIVEELAAKLGLEVDGESFEKGSEAIEGLKIGFGAVAAIAAAAGGALLEMAHSTAEYAIETSKAAQRTGVTTEAIQELNYAAQASDVSQDSLQQGMVILSRTMEQAAEGSKEAAFHLGKLGVRMYEANGQARPTDEILGDIAERISNMPDGFKKTALAQQAFGRSGAELLPLLNKGRAGIAELREEASKYGVVLGEDVTEAAERWEKQQKHLTAALKGLRLAIGGALLKTVGDLTDRIAEWVARNRELIATRVMAFIEGVAQVLKPLADGIGFILEKTEFWEGALLALAAALAIVNWPLLLMIGALLAIEDFYGFLEGKDSITGMLFKDESTRNSIRAFMKEVKDFVQFLFSGHLFDESPKWMKDILHVMGGTPLENASNSGVTGTPTAAQLSSAIPLTSLSPAERGLTGLQAFAHMLLGPSDIERGVSVAMPPPPSIQAPGSMAAPAVPAFNYSQVIYAAPGMDTKEIASRSAEATGELVQKQLREAAAAHSQ